MRNTLRYVLLCILLGALAACQSTPQDPNFKTDLKPIETLPEIQVQLLDSTTCSLSEKLPTNKITLLYYFDPECPHCKLETAVLLKNKLAKEEAHIAFLSNATLSDIRRYDSSFRISNYRNTTLGKDIKWSFTRYINTGSFPLLVMYNKSKKLEKIFAGEIDETILSDFLKKAL